MMIDQDLLYSSDPLVIRKFIQDGPFTAGMPEGAPAMLGKWIGWQIVRNYMQKNEETDLTGFLMPQIHRLFCRSRGTSRRNSFFFNRTGIFFIFPD